MTGRIAVMRHTDRLSILLLCLLAVAPHLGGQEAPARPALTPVLLEQRLGTEWFGIYRRGAKFGYLRVTVARAAATPPACVVTTQVVLHTVSDGRKSYRHTTDRLEFAATFPFALLRASTSQRDGSSEQQVTLERTSEGIRVVTHAGADKSTKNIAAIDYTLEDCLACYVWLRGRPAAGASLLTQELDLEQLRCDRERRKLLGIGTALVAGTKVTCYEVECTDLREKTTTLERYGAKGNLLSGYMGGAYELRAEPEAQAKTIKAAVDLYALGLVKIDRPLGDPLRITELIVEVVGSKAALLESGPWQTIARTSSGSRLCKIGKKYDQETRATADEIKEALADTPTYPAAHPRVQAVAREAIGAARTTREKLERLVHFVHEYLQPSDQVKGTIVLAVLDKKEGDCTAYAALVTTLARAAGIPARDVAGLAYDDDAKAFGGHAWNEVVLDGRWVPIDASRDQLEIDATHIRCSSDSQLAQLLGDISLHLVERTTRAEGR